MDISDDTTLFSDDSAGAVTQYRQIADLAMFDFVKWLRDGASSRAMTDATPDAVLVRVENGTCISVNAEFERMRRSDIIGAFTDMLVLDVLIRVVGNIVGGHRAPLQTDRQAWSPSGRGRYEYRRGYSQAA